MDEVKVALLPYVQAAVVTGVLIKTYRLFKTDVSQNPQISRALFRMHAFETLVSSPNRSKKITILIAMH
jgi:hypothetical protein